MATVRPGTDDDLPALRRIQATALAEPWPTLLELAVADDGPRLRVLAADDAILGYVVAVTAAHPDAYLPELAVTPARQGEGLGSQLLRSLLAELAGEGFERVRLTARATDQRILAFYRGHGFDAVERVPDHFEAGDGVVLVRTL